MADNDAFKDVINRLNAEDEHNCILPENINHILGPHGETVVVVRPNQNLTISQDSGNSEQCAYCCCGIALISISSGFIIICMALSISGLSNFVSIGFYYLIIPGLVAFSLYGLCMYCWSRDHDQKVRFYMHDPERAVQEEAVHLIELSTSPEEASSSFTSH